MREVSERHDGFHSRARGPSSSRATPSGGQTARAGRRTECNAASALMTSRRATRYSVATPDPCVAGPTLNLLP